MECYVLHENINVCRKKADTVDTVTDFWIKLGIKPLKNLERSIFSSNDVIFSSTKIMSNLLKDCKILTFKVIFQYQKQPNLLL